MSFEEIYKFIGDEVSIVYNNKHYKGVLTCNILYKICHLINIYNGSIILEFDPKDITDIKKI